MKPSPIRIGHYFDGQTAGDRNEYEGERHLLVFGLNGAGKSTRFLIENLVTLKDRSIVVFDVKGELAAQTARTRRKICGADNVKIINPYGVVGMPSDGYNPLAILDPDNEDEFSDGAEALADAIVEIEAKDPHWSESAQGLMQAGIMWEVMQARKEGRAPSLFRVRQLLTERDRREGGKRDGKIISGITFNAVRMHSEGGEIIASLIGRFLREEGQNELSGIQSTFDTQTRFLLSPPLAKDLVKGSGNYFRQLREKPTTVYIVLPPQQINRKRRWTRLLLSAALMEHMRPGPVKTLFVLDEFRASVGHLQIISDVWSLVRGYGIQLMPVVQSATQLKALYKDEWENFAGQAGVVMTLGAASDLMTAKWMSELCGTETFWQSSPSSGESRSAQGVNRSDNESWSQSGRPFLMPQDIRSLRVGEGLMWTPGFGARPHRFIARWYKYCREVAPLVDKNPYYHT